jgi:replicative DNA helicase
LSDLRDSGAIEQDADVVQFIYRPEYYNFDVTPEQYQDPFSQDLILKGANAEIIWAKNRSGSLNTYLLKWVGDKTKFVDLADPHETFDETPPF